MKKILFIIFLFISIGRVDALNFYEGDFITGEYINKVDGNKTYYMTMQYIHDGNGNIVYCIEPFTKFYENYNYQLTDPYLNYDSNTLRRVELLSYYGYGYKNRTDIKWYVITQYLIWKSVSNNDIYFTDKLNGRRIDKYQVEINELNNDVNGHDSNNLIKEYDSGEMKLYHMDVYRLNGKCETLGLEDYFNQNGICIIEWSDMICDCLPEERLQIDFKILSC